VLIVKLYLLLFITVCYFIKIQVVGVASYIYETVKIIDTGLKVHIVATKSPQSME